MLRRLYQLIGGTIFIPPSISLGSPFKDFFVLVPRYLRSQIGTVP